MKLTKDKISELPHIKFNGKRICLLTNYRTASTYFIRETFFTNKILGWSIPNIIRDFDS